MKRKRRRAPALCTQNEKTGSTEVTGQKRNSRLLHCLEPGGAGGKLHKDIAKTPVSRQERNPIHNIAHVEEECKADAVPTGNRIQDVTLLLSFFDDLVCKVCHKNLTFVKESIMGYSQSLTFKKTLKHALIAKPFGTKHLQKGEQKPCLTI